MSVITTVSDNEFASWMREIYPGEYSGYALDFLYEWYDGLDKDWDFDACEVHVEWDEYEDAGDVWQEYSWMIPGAGVYDPDRYDELLEAMADRMTCCRLGNGHTLVHEVW